jgi:hypothetical protein
MNNGGCLSGGLDDLWCGKHRCHSVVRCGRELTDQTAKDIVQVKVLQYPMPAGELQRRHPARRGQRRWKTSARRCGRCKTRPETTPGYVTVDLPPSMYESTISLSTAVYAEIARAPGD